MANDSCQEAVRYHIYKGPPIEHFDPPPDPPKKPLTAAELGNRPRGVTSRNQYPWRRNEEEPPL